MKHYTDKLKEFNKAFGVQTAGNLESACALRFKLMKEENLEYISAEDGDEEEIIDAIADMLYILAGTIVHHGFEDRIQKAFDIVHASNMSKLDDNGKAIVNGKNGVYDSSRPVGKILKSSNFVEPCFATLID